MQARQAFIPWPENREWELILEEPSPQSEEVGGSKGILGVRSTPQKIHFEEAPKITADGDCSHEIKRCLLLGRKAMTNLDSILKSRDITLPTRVHLVKAMGFSSSHVWM